MVAPAWVARGRTVLGPGDAPKLMAILNVTPDSFSDGDPTRDTAAALTLAERLVAEGADLLDIGGESSRPGAEPVALDEELRRVIPVVAALAERVAVPISVDTAKPEVARAAIDAGAVIVNDIGGLREPAMTRLVAETGAGVVIMHMAGTPRTMQRNPTYADVVAEVRADLEERLRRAEAAGIGRSQVVIDPGIGFGKTTDQNLQLLRHLDQFVALGVLVLVGTSRKRFLGQLTGREVSDRVAASVASALAAANRGAQVVRVHDVSATADAFRVWAAQHGWPELSHPAPVAIVDQPRTMPPPIPLPPTRPTAEDADGRRDQA